jgi:hypothetical protein
VLTHHLSLYSKTPDHQHRFTHKVGLAGDSRPSEPA